MPQTEHAPGTIFTNSLPLTLCGPRRRTTFLAFFIHMTMRPEDSILLARLLATAFYRVLIESRELLARLQVSMVEYKVLLQPTEEERERMDFEPGQQIGVYARLREERANLPLARDRLNDILDKVFREPNQEYRAALRRQIELLLKEYQESERARLDRLFDQPEGTPTEHAFLLAEANFHRQFVADFAALQVADIAGVMGILSKRKNQAILLQGGGGPDGVDKDAIEYRRDMRLLLATVEWYQVLPDILKVIRHTLYLMEEQLQEPAALVS